MALLSRIKQRFSRDKVDLQLDDIQALILRNRPEPYCGVHAMLHVDEAEGGRDLIARVPLPSRSANARPMSSIFTISATTP